MKSLIVVLTLILAGLPAAVAATTRAAPATPAAMAAEDYVANAAEFVDAANWEEMQELTVELDEFSFTPSDLTLVAGLPYELTIRNVGEEKHYFTAHEFYRAIATRKAENAQSEVKVPYFTAIEVYPGQEVGSTSSRSYRGPSSSSARSRDTRTRGWLARSPSPVRPQPRRCR